MGRKNLIHVERIIDAAPDAVFAVLDDFERYPEWNVFTERVITSRELGGPVVLHVNLPGKKQRVMHERFSGYVEGRRLSWGLRWGRGILLDCDRVQEVLPLPDGRTRYVTYEAFKGLLGGLIVRLYGEPVRRGFELCADSLVKRMQALAPRR
jgi:uncharacterized protein YndB with AHSA1/START domain